MTSTMHLPAPVSPAATAAAAAAAAIPISPPADDVQSHSSSSSSSFVSWCESQHGSLPTTHQRLLDTAKQQGKNTDAAVVPVPTTSAPPATKVGLQTSVGVLHQFYDTEKKYGRRTRRVKSPPKAAAQVVTDDEGANDDDSDAASHDNEDDDELGEGDGDDSYASSDESVPEVVEIPATAGQEDEDLSSIFDLSVDEMLMMSEGEYEEGEGEEDEEEEDVEPAQGEENRDEENALDYGPGLKAAMKNSPDINRDVGIADNSSKNAFEEDAEAGAITNEEPTMKKTTRFDLPSPINGSKKKVVSFVDDEERSKNRNESRSNKKSTYGENEKKKKKKRRSRYISSASSTKAVIRSFMSHTRASMAKTRRSLSKGNKSTNKASSGSDSGPKPGGTKQAKRNDNNKAAPAAADEPTNANVTDAVDRAKQRIRQHRQKVRNQGDSYQKL